MKSDDHVVTEQFLCECEAAIRENAELRNELRLKDAAHNMTVAALEVTIEDLRGQVAEAQKQLKHEIGQHDCWHVTAKNLQKGYNELDAKCRELRRQLAAYEAGMPHSDKG